MINKVTILTITSVLAIANVMCIPVSNADPVGSALNAESAQGRRVRDNRAQGRAHDNRAQGK